jgi:hypothetical protein
MQVTNTKFYESRFVGYRNVTGGQTKTGALLQLFVANAPKTNRTRFSLIEQNMRREQISLTSSPPDMPSITDGFRDSVTDYS